MQNLFDQIVQQNLILPDDSEELEQAKKRLRETLSEEQKRQLLYIIDEKEAQIWYAAFDNLSHGLRLGAQLARDLDGGQFCRRTME